MLYLFNNQLKIIKIVTRKRLLAVKQELEINVADKLMVELPSNTWVEVEEKPFYMGVRDVENKNNFHMYKILKPVIKGNITELTGINIGYDELRGNGYIKDRRFNNNTAGYVADVILEGTSWEVGYIDPELSNVSTNFYYVNRLKALSDLLEITQGEVIFRIEVSGNRIISKRMDIYKRIGVDKGKRFAYGSKLLSVEKEEDNSELYTALVGRGRGEEVVNEEGEPTGGFGRKITFEDVVWSKANGDPVDKPLGQEYVEIPELTELYGYPDGSPRVDIVDYPDVEDKELLLELAYRDLVEKSRQKVQFKSTVVNIGDVDLGETVSIIRDDIGIRYKTRVYKIVRDYLNNYKTEINLGDKIGYSIATQINRIDNAIDRAEQGIIEISYTAANGKNKIFRSPVEPTEGMAKNDIWYKPVGEGEVEMYMWNGDIWELEAYSADQLRGTVNFANLNAINFNANAITTGILEGGKVKWNLDTGHFLIGNNEEDYTFKWDGTKMSIRMDNGNTLEEEIEEGLANAPIHTWIKYSNNPDGSDMSDDSNSEYIGISVGNESSTPIEDPSLYNWTKIRGEDGVIAPVWSIGEDGYWYVDGEKTNKIAVGQDGVAPIWEIGEDGFWYVDGVKTDKKAIGEDGYTPIKGIDYFDGKDGEANYVYVRYSQNSDGNPMTTDPEGAKYIGIITTDNPSPPSYNLFNWTLIKGQDGIDGSSSYLHIKYSDDGGLTFTGNDGEDVGKWIGMYVSEVEADSMIPGDYTWNKIEVDADIYEGTIEPDELKDGIIWLDTSMSPPMFKVYQNDMWVELGTDLTKVRDDIDDLREQFDNKVDIVDFDKLADDFELRKEEEDLKREQAEIDFKALDDLVDSINTEMGNTVRKWNFINTNITHSELGIRIQNNESNMSIMLGDDRISFFDGTNEVASISNTTMEITHGLFLKSITIDKYKFEQPDGSNVLNINYVG